MRGEEKISKELKGSINIELCMVFPIILSVIFILSVVSVYYSDIISIRTYLEKKLIKNFEQNKDIEDIENEISNELRSLVVVSDLENLKISEKGNKVRIAVDMSLSVAIFNIKLRDMINVEIDKEDSRSYVVRNKVFFENLKNVGG